MTTSYPTSESVTPVTWVAIDIAKDAHVIVVESPGGQRRLRVANTLEDIEQLIAFLRTQPAPVRIAFEPTGMYHRPLAYRLVTAGFDVVLVCARHREVCHLMSNNSHHLSLLPFRDTRNG